MPNTTSVSLVAGMAERPHDSNVWAQFVLTYGEQVVYWCMRYGLQEADARDVAQDVLLRFWRQATRLDSGGPPRRFRAFLKTLTHAAWADWCDQFEPREAARGGTEYLSLLRQLPAREELLTKLEETYDAELLQLAMAKVEGRVEPHTWAAFRMLALEHRPGREVADQLGMAINTVFVARKKVQRLIRETIHQLEESSGS